MKYHLSLLAVLTCFLAPNVGFADENTELAKQTRNILKKYCHTCHGQNASAEGGFSYALDFPKMIAKKVKPGDPAKSRLFKRMGIDKDMPPDYEDDLPRPTDQEIAIVKKWIEAKAPLPPADETIVSRPFLDTEYIINAIDKDIRKTPRQDRRFRRYFTLTHLHNSSKVQNKDFRSYQAALSKMLNSLSWKRDLVVPKPIDEHRTIFAIDLRDLDWDQHELWDEVLRLYPYGLKHDRYPDDEKLTDKASDIYTSTGTPMPFLRADWFIATAGRPPLYHTLLYDKVLPTLKDVPVDRDNPSNPKGMTAKHLEDYLGVDVVRNFQLDRLARAGFIKSGVSGQNRLIERHASIHGTYWKSYDFLPNTEFGNLLRFPLGPRFEKNPFPKLAFEHDGGEIITSLPNGFLAFLLIDGKDKRIDSGPINVVSDGKKTSGTPVIVNGLSCMACHVHGMIRDFEYDVRTSNAVRGDSKKKLQRLYPGAEAMKKLLDKDEARFLVALEGATKDFLKVGEDKDKNIREFREPVGPIARWYFLEELNLEAVADELGFEDAKKLGTIIEASRKLQRLGLGTLPKGGTIKRAEWEKIEGTSLFQDTARELSLGTPIR